MSSIRIPFEVAIQEKRLLKDVFDLELSRPQQVALKTLYGVQLDDVARDAAGFTEVDYWYAFQGFAEYDQWGHLLSTHRRGEGIPLYSPRKWREAWFVAGVRAGKSQSFAAPIIAYEATCGGHEQWLRKDTRGVCFLIAQDLRFARWALPNVRAVLEKMPFMRSRITRETADRIDLWNGISIGVAPPSVKAVRGYDSPVAVFDEVGVWPQDDGAANQDTEVYRQIQSRQAQFSDPLTVGVSSPWCKSGLLYERHQAGTDGHFVACRDHLDAAKGECKECEKAKEPHKGILVLHATTASLQNPVVKEEWLKNQERQDPKAFERECLARFVDVISGFLDPALLDAAVERGVRERDPHPRGLYLAAIDPAFRHDAFGLCIVHHEAEKGIVVDVLKKWPEVNDKRREALNPSIILDEVAEILKKYDIKEVCSDQFHFDTLNQLALQRGFSIRQVPFTGASKAELYGNLQQILRQGRLKMIDHPATVRELKMIEKRNMPGGTIKIGAPRGEHDDMATVVTLASHQAVWMLPFSVVVEKKRTPEEYRAEALFDRINRKVAMRAREKEFEHQAAMSGEGLWD